MKKKRGIQGSESKLGSESEDPRVRIQGSRIGSKRFSLIHYLIVYQIKEFETLVSSAGLKIKKHLYDCGNEIFFLEDPTIIQ